MEVRFLVITESARRMTLTRRVVGTPKDMDTTILACCCQMMPKWKRSRQSLKMGFSASPYLGTKRRNELLGRSKSSSILYLSCRSSSAVVACYMVHVSHSRVRNKSMRDNATLLVF